MKQNKLSLFSKGKLMIITKDKKQIKSLKQNVSLFAQLYMCHVKLEMEFQPVQVQKV